MRLLSLVVVVWLLLGTALAARADEALSPEAQGYLDRGLAHYAAHEYAAAVAEFQAGYAVEPRRELLFAWAQAARLGGDCAAALELYKRFLETDPPIRQAAAARHGITRCEAEIAAHPPVVAVEKEEPEDPPPPIEPVEPPPQPTVVEERPWYLDPLGAGLMGAGVVSLGVGVTFYALSVSNADAAAGSATYERYDEEIKRAETRRSVAVVSLVAGACLVGAGALRYGWFVPARRRPAAVAVWLEQGGGGLVLGGTF